MEGYTYVFLCGSEKAAEMKRSGVAGYLSLLEEGGELCEYAIEGLDELIDDFWPELAEGVQKLEILYEDDKFSGRDKAALLASKVYYYLGDKKAALQYALHAGKQFSISSGSNYHKTLINHCIDAYVAAQVGGEAYDVAVDRLEGMMEEVFQQCELAGDWKTAIGIAVEARQVERIRKLLSDKEALEEKLDMLYEVLTQFEVDPSFRNTILEMMNGHYASFPEEEVAMKRGELYLLLGDMEGMAGLLGTLTKAGGESKVLGFQIAFHLVENAPQVFLQGVRKGVSEEEVEMHKILSGKSTVEKHLAFLNHSNKADAGIMAKVRSANDVAKSIIFTSVLLCNAFMQAGTTHDGFLRDNMEWLKRASGWSRFVATSSLGVIQRGNHEKSGALLDRYLPKGDVSTQPYVEGGALFANGLIHANFGDESIQMFMGVLLNDGAEEVVHHGACLGLGLAALGTHRSELVDVLQNVLYTDRAVCSEAAAIGMGLILAGQGGSCEEMFAYAHSTQHDKISRGLGIGIALVNYGQESRADGIISQMLEDEQLEVRYGGVFTAAMAYVGTANHRPIKQLLHVAVSDVSDEVRKAAVIGLGFILCRQPAECAQLVSMFTESYNPHVRYGAALALGIAGAGKGHRQSVTMLLKLISDSVDFVRQGGMVGAGLVLQQISEEEESLVGTIRQEMLNRACSNREEVMSKMGACMGLGLIDAGGRNSVVRMETPMGKMRMPGVIGMCLFTQFWYWHPYAQFISLSMVPMAMIGLNRNLDMPKLTFESQASPKRYAYPAPYKGEEKVKPTKVKTAELSITKKVAKREQQKKLYRESLDGSMSMDVDPPKVEVEEEGEVEEEEGEVVEEEEKRSILDNLSRVTMNQAKYIRFDKEGRYYPVSGKENATGIVMLIDREEGEMEELVELRMTESDDNDEEEAPLPEPFDYVVE